MNKRELIELKTSVAKESLNFVVAKIDLVDAKIELALSCEKLHEFNVIHYLHTGKFLF